MKSIEVIEKLSGKKPRGYVAPWWEMSASTAALLQKYGFKYDHSQGYRDFQPFYARVGDSWTLIDYSKQAEEWMKPLKHGKEIDLVEIGANWYVDDLPPMMFIKKAPNSHGFVNPRDIEDLWRQQFDWVYREMDYAAFCFTIHPDVSGRPQVIMMLERLIEYVNGHARSLGHPRRDRGSFPEALSLQRQGNDLWSSEEVMRRGSARECGWLNRGFPRPHRPIGRMWPQECLRSHPRLAAAGTHLSPALACHGPTVHYDGSASVSFCPTWTGPSG